MCRIRGEEHAKNSECKLSVVCCIVDKDKIMNGHIRKSAHKEFVAILGPSRPGASLSIYREEKAPGRQEPRDNNAWCQG